MSSISASRVSKSATLLLKPDDFFEIPQKRTLEDNDMELDALFPEGTDSIEEFLIDTNNLRLSQLPGSIDFS